MNRRLRSFAVLAALAAGAVAIIASTQTWFVVTLSDGADTSLPVAGADAVPVLAPLALAVLALGAALSIAGRVLAYVVGALAAAAGIALIALTLPLQTGATTQAVASTVTEATGLAGLDAVADLVASTSSTPWPAFALLAAVLAAVAGAMVLTTAHRWSAVGRRYRTDTRPAASRRDPIDAWDDLSHGEDPTR